MGEHAPEPVVFSNAFEGLARRFRPQLSPALLAELRQAGLDFDRLQTAYPLETWERTVRRLAAELYPGLPEADAWRRLGREFIEGYAQTLLGRSVLALGKVVGTRRFMERLGHNLRTASNYAVVTVRTLGPAEVEIESRIAPEFLARWTQRATVMHPYRLGVVEGALLALGVTPEVELLSVDPAAQRATYRARWR